MRMFRMNYDYNGVNNDGDGYDNTGNDNDNDYGYEESNGMALCQFLFDLVSNSSVYHIYEMCDLYARNMFYLINPLIL